MKQLLNSVRTITTTVIMLIILVLTSCNFSSAIEPGLGSIRLIVPPVGSLEVIEYRVYGNGPSGRTIDELFPASSSEIYITNLISGEWTFFVDSLNSDSAPVYSGQGTVFIETDLNVNLSITLSPIQGEGRLAVEYSWPIGVLDQEVVTTELALYDGSDFGLAIPLEPFIFSGSNS